MSDKGFSKYDTETLLTIRKNLLGNLEKVGQTIEAGSFHKTRSKGGASPAQFGHLVLGLLLSLQEELDERGHPLTW
jgi:hypothetical protein